MKTLELRWQQIGFSLLRAVSFCLIASAVVVTIEIILNGGFGIRDLIPFTFLTLLFTIGIGVVSLALIIPYAFIPRWLTYLLAVILGIMCSFVWTMTVSILLGPWVRAFSFPILPPWLAGGISGLFASAGLTSKAKQGNLIIEGLLLIVLSCSIPLLFPLLRQSPNEREIRMVQGVWEPGSEPLTFTGLTETFKKDEKRYLETLGLTGQIYIGRTGIEGGEVGKKKERVRVVLIMYQPIKEPIDLFIPAEGSIMYVQTEDGWKTYPSDVPTLEQAIHLVVSEEDPTMTEYWIEVPGGVSSGIAY